ncbi:type III polyketide synthase [Deinococcus detaillensis]|uniref:Type III polyketide synthase n=1 Tax=Deinococcus detaillensis TaxID=2592048 RepID=A0A553V5X8_9DEIO|nr:3-oxoacyl-[acyl-carrier-protein] synthase III C-terminal domain-containing protein [Deinococcus detaillensis]TSA87631.1 type III polyketide synthase [Deinococcus detaillensis]
MSVYIHALASATPETVYDQSELRDMVKIQPQLTRLSQRLVGSIYNASGIDRRASVISELKQANLSADQSLPAGLFYDPAERRLLEPSTKERNELYAEEAPKLFIEAARRSLAACPEVQLSDITHVITVSCTGFYAPGPEYDVVRALDLAPTTQRFHVGFMGCYAAFPALRMAKAFCEAQPDATVLVICAELCSIHMRVANDPDTLIASSLFADGASAAIVSARTDLGHRAKLRFDDFETTLTPVGIGQKDMAWRIGDQGFEMVLSTYVPDIIEAHIQGALAPMLARESALTDAPYSQIERWAIHPGGRSILDKVEASLELSQEQLAPSREVLRDYGNMSSATVMFILEQHLNSAAEQSQPHQRLCAMAFGPGLTVEMGLMTVCRGS